MTEAQKLILADVRRAAKSWRVPSGAIRPDFFAHFDRRSLKGLFSRGLLTVDANGNVVASK